MSIYRFVVTEQEDSALIDYAMEVETQDSPIFTIDECGLKEWSLFILQDVVAGTQSHNSLLDESVHVRFITPNGEVIIDTISNRQKQ